ncbi:MAG: energy transducer TonB [Rhodoplanes sp.]|uniref:energy transducer TonB family protein n=1 Tax=Rhodoplanes sp. TaxID=1968906 RepID=UPI0017F56C4F|nr:TonB family protein [Rhodoplanes sp.]NVO17549.1 energy transducer TonB [Rhodoplanes sp.]
MSHRTVAQLMTLTAQRDEPTGTARPGDATRWRACVLLAATLHVAGAAALVASAAVPEPEQDGGVPVVMVEIALVAAAPEPAPAELAPGPSAVSATEPDRTEAPPETPPAEAPVPEPVAAPVPPPDPTPPIIEPDALPAPTPPPPKPAAMAAAEEPPVATAPPSAAASAPKPAVAAAGTRTQAAPATIAHWQTRLLALLHRHKRYPAAAGGRTGVTRVAFTIDREGRLQRRAIATSSGSDALDAEALALIDRAGPFPPPPAELPDAALSFVVPIRFTASGG